jgi:putative peptidoglycan lipid II flippase
VTEPSLETDSVVRGSMPLARRSIAFLGSLNLVAQVGDRLLVFGQIALVAAVFGVSAQADLFFLVSIVPLTIGSVVGEPLGRAFLTVLVRSGTRREGASVAAAGFLFTAGTLVALTTLYLAVAYPVVRSAEPAGSSDFSPWIIAGLMAPGLGLSAYLGAVLLWLHDYVWSALRAPLASAATLALIVVVAPVTHGVTWIVAAVSAGYVIGFAVLFGRVAFAIGGGWLLRTTRVALGQAWELRAKVVPPTLGGLLGGQAIVLLERTLAASLGPGAVALVSYARGIASAPTIVGAAMGAGAYPGLVRAEASDSQASMRQSFLSALRLTATVGGGIAAFLAVFGSGVASFLFERGAFELESANRVGVLLTAFAVSTAAGSLIAYLIQALYGVNRFAAVLYVQAATFATYVAAATVLRASFGLVGLAVGFSIAQTVGALTGALIVGRGLGLKPLVLLSRAAAPVAVGVLLTTAALIAYRVAVDRVGVSTEWRGVVRIGGGSVCLALSLATVLLVSGQSEGQRIRDLVRSRLFRRG